MIYLDTDFLVNSIKHKVDFASQILDSFPNAKFAVFDKSFDELKKIGSIDSKTAIALIRIKGFKIIKTKKDKTVDDLIVEIVKKHDMVATQDKELKRRLKEKGIKIITIRQKNYVDI